MNRFNQSHAEEAALAWLREAGWHVARGPDIASDMPGAERRDFGNVVLVSRFRAALARLNTTVAGWMPQTLVGGRESGTLASLRVTLLPMLIYGRLWAPDAERMAMGIMA